jgi:hypothetical protein
MLWSADDIKNFPQCTLVMQSRLQPKTLKKDQEKVFSAFLRACGGTKKSNGAALKALTWGEYPIVGVVQGLIDGQDCGQWKPAFPNVVRITSRRVTPLEECIQYGVSQDVADNTRLFECTLLHEIVHFVRYRVDLMDSDWDFPDSEEPGTQFELWAYGELQCTRDSLFRSAATYM